MKSWEFWHDQPNGTRVLDVQTLQALTRGPLQGKSDLEVAVALARFTHEEFEDFGTKGAEITDLQSGIVMQALKAVLMRLGIRNFSLPFRDFPTFQKYWKAEGASGGGGWQARRDILHTFFDALHKVLDEREAGSIVSTLATPVSPQKVTGWPKVDEELSELRRHFESASTQQDYSNVGNDCVAVLEALSESVYDQAKHKRGDEPEPPVDKTKDRLDRFIEVELVGAENAELRKLARATIELAQAVKHRRATVTRLEAGISSDAVILLSNLLRRIQG